MREALKLNKNLMISIILFVICCIININLFIYDSKVLYSECLERDEEKTINEENDKFGSFMLSYGPYHQTRKGYYLVILNYETDTSLNQYKVYSDNLTYTINEGTLTEGTKYVFNVVKVPNIKMQVLTFYNGVGMLHVKTVSVIPVWLLILMISIMILLGVYFAVRDNLRVIIQNIIVGLNIICFVGTVYYADDSENAIARSLFMAILLIGGLICCFAPVFNKLTKRIGVFLCSLITCWFIEWNNILNYNFKFKTLYITILISLCIYCLIFIVIRKNSRFYAGCLIVTGIFSFYSVIQYTYFTYFKDFFTAKIVRLIFTAAEATSSIQELITDKVISYLLILGTYYFVCSAIIMKDKIICAIHKVKLMLNDKKG